MNTLSADRFTEFYQAATLAIAIRDVELRRKKEPDYQPDRQPEARSPFPWQVRLAKRVCDPDSAWPTAIALPTASGKTVCIDIAIFALACQAKLRQRTTPRRIFFVVDRRVVVDQAYLHARNLATVLADAAKGNARSGILKEVAEALISLADTAGSEDARPLDVYVLRGGMYREDTWIRTPLQPTVITSTVDQVGSRLLFRGYGVTDSMKPIHAGLVGNDALILLDEAHCAKPFAETVNAVSRYRGWNPSLAPFRFVTITATPSSDIPGDQIERDEQEDRDHPVLGKRLMAAKPAKLVIVEKAKGKKWQEPLVAEMAKHARRLIEEGNLAVGIIVNRVATARALTKLLRQEPDKKTGTNVRPDVILLTGRMRPLDRDIILKQLDPLFSGQSNAISPTVVAATPCLEVGADLDLHALVVECASFDALRQRFGRLNRLGNRPTANAVVVIRGDQTEDSLEDPVYGQSLAETWKWLKRKSQDDHFDFGVSAVRKAVENEDLIPLNAPARSAPVLLPAHLDSWVQTSPIPMPDPDPALFLHGMEQPGTPDVLVVFRADLGTAQNASQWADIVSLSPPSSSEALPVRIDVFRKWLSRTFAIDDSADIEGGSPMDENDQPTANPRYALCWAGKNNSQTLLITDPGDVRPNRTYIVSPAEEDLDCLGDFPPKVAHVDYGDIAFQRSRDRVMLRLTHGTIEQWPDGFPKSEADKLAKEGIPEDDPEFDERLTAFLETVGRSQSEGEPWESLKLAGLRLARDKRRQVVEHPAGGIIITGKRRLRQFDPTFADEESNESPVRRAVTLEDHTNGVIAYAHQFSRGCGFDGLIATFVTAARWHDLGKADPRFQAMVQGRSPRTYRQLLLAKSGIDYQTREESEAARTVHGFPKGGRHEILSVAAVSTKTDDILLLFLIETHHGYAHPFIPWMEEGIDIPIAFSLSFLGESFIISPKALDPAYANMTAPQRFWKIIRTYGWWGAAYLEAVFRLADHAASRAEQEEDYNPKAIPIVRQPEPPLAAQPQTLHALPLTGLDGSNPLAFLAAVGTLNVLTATAHEESHPDWLSKPPFLSWGTMGSSAIAILHFAAPVDENTLVSFLSGYLTRDLQKHPVASVLELLMEKDVGRRSQFMRKTAGETVPNCRVVLDWIAALASEFVPEAASQLQTVRRDYLEGNLRSVMSRTDEQHLRRCLFSVWDYADGLDNQSLHWEPSEDRRHAYQWFVPTADPTRKRRGGMMGANRLAIEAWPLFLSVPLKDKLSTRGFSGVRVDGTTWTWPIWSSPMDLDAVGSFIGLPTLQTPKLDQKMAQGFGIIRAFRSRRILVGKTPNLTQATAVV